MRFWGYFVVILAALRCSGAAIPAISTLHSITITNISDVQPSFSLTDLKIVGPGYFTVRDADGRKFLTRHGDFVIDQDGYLASNMDFHLQGYGSDLKTIGDIRIAVPDGESPLASYQIKPDGKVIAALSNGLLFPCGQILLTTGDGLDRGLPFPGGLILPPDGTALPPPKIPGHDGAGVLLPANLEIQQPILSINTSSPRFSAQYVDTDLAIRGRGFFILRDPNTGARYATRAGAFYWDANGYLVNYAGLRVQAQQSSGDSIHDLQLQYLPDQTEIIFRSIDWWGQVSAPVDNQLVIFDRLLLTDLPAKKTLPKNAFGVYELPAGDLTDYAYPGDASLGNIFAGALDLREMNDEIIAARKQMNFFIRGSYVPDGVETHLYINGQRGLFIVRDPTSNAFYATREGAFQIETSGWLTTKKGLRVQGRNAVGQTGDIFIDVANMANIQIKSTGEIIIVRTDATETSSGQILLQDFRNPHALTRLPNDLYSNIENASPRYPDGGAPETYPLGSLIAGALESIQLDPGIQIPPPNAVCLQLANLPWNARIESSTNLRDWTPVNGTLGADTGTISFFDLSASTTGARFYRTVTVQTP